MLKKVQIHNVNSIKDCTIDFEKSKYLFLNENIYHNKIVNPIAFYGTNGSGKTSFINAVAQLVDILWKEPGKYGLLIPNLFLNENSSKIKLWFEIDNEEYTYEMETNYKEGIINESLSINNILYFEKIDSFKYKFNDVIELLESPNYSVLRKLGLEQKEDKIKKAYNYLSAISFIDSSKKVLSSKVLSQKSIYDLMVEKSSDVKEILSTYDSFPIYSYGSRSLKEGNKYYYITMTIKGKEYELYDAFVSDGMRNQSVLLSILLSIPENSLMIIDGIEVNIHSFTIINFLEVVRKKNIQLIFTSHNTHILQSLRPDQIIFANWKDSVSEYKKLSDIYPNIREVNNIEKMYLSNLFDEVIKNK